MFSSAPRLRADTAVPSGNGSVLGIDESAPIPSVHFAAVPSGGPEAIWFHLRIEPPKDNPPHAVRCVLHFFENLLGNAPGCSTDGFAPVFKTTRRDWTRVISPPREEQADGQPLITWEVPGDEGEIRVALSYPYASDDVDALLRDTATAFGAHPIGLTPEAAPILRLSNHPGRAGDNRAGVYCLGRQHASEAPGSWVLDGFLRQIAAHGDAAPLVWAVPLADTDGVAAGRPGKDAFPWDFNRAWGSKLFGRENLREYGSHPMRHEVKCVQHDLLRWRSRCQPRLVLDFHAPVTCHTLGIFAYLRDLPEGEPDAAHAPWIEAIEQAIDQRHRATPFAHSGRYPSRWNTARLGDFAVRALQLPQVTIEAPYSHCRDTLLVRADYEAAGRRIADAIMSVIASSPEEKKPSSIVTPS